MEKLTTITIAGKAYPIRCDLNVLEKVQEEFGTIQGFERSLLGVKLVKDEDGNQVYTKEGDPAIELGEPSVKAVKFCLITMINEGLELQAFQKHKEFIPMEEMDILQKCDINCFELAKILHDEYKKCFITKKS